MKKIFLLIIVLSTVTSCGKKSGLDYPGGQKKPDFSKIIDD
jgi:predicted small lipoprotein YifL